MDVSTFYSMMAAACFTLVGLWWTVVARHPEWKSDRLRRQLAGGVYLSFLLPALMSTFAQVDVENPLIWRMSFTIASVIGGANTLILLAAEGSVHRGPFRRFRWLVIVGYGAIVLFGLVPELVSPLGITALQAAAVSLILLIVLAHGLAWDFMMEPAESDDAQVG